MNENKDIKCNCIGGKFFPHRRTKCLASKVKKNLDQQDQVIRPNSCISTKIDNNAVIPVDNIELYSIKTKCLGASLKEPNNNSNEQQQIQDMFTNINSQHEISMILDILMKECTTSENIADLIKFINKVEKNAASKVSEDSCNCLSSRYMPHRRNKCLTTKVVKQLEERDGAIWIDDHYIKALNTTNTYTSNADNEIISNEYISYNSNNQKVDDDSTERTELELATQLSDVPSILHNVTNFNSQHEISMILDILMKECTTSENITDLMKMINIVEKNATSKVSEDSCNCLISRYMPHRRNKCLTTKVIKQLEERDGAIWIDDHYIKALNTTNTYTSNTDNEIISNEYISYNNTRELNDKMIKDDYRVKCDIINQIIVKKDDTIKENSKQINTIYIDSDTQKKIDEQERIIQYMQLKQQEIINIQKKQEKCLQSQQFINMQRQQYINMLKLRITELEKEKYKESNQKNNYNANNAIDIGDLDSNLDDESLTITSDDID